MRAFSYFIGANLVLGALASASALLILRIPPSRCEFNGINCADLNARQLTFLALMPFALFSLVALCGVRVNRHSPRAAFAIVAVPVVITLALVLGNLVAIGV
jgi:hypothetical protein